MSALNPNFEILVARLDKVKKERCKPDQVAAFRAVCPACADGDRSKLSVAENNAGAILINCYGGECGGCLTVLAALGMKPSDLYPPRVAGTNFARGNGGPACWAGAAGAADAVEDAAIAIATGGGSIFTLMEAVSAFKRSARAAMRADVSNRKAVAA